MKTGASLKNRQGGAVAVMVGISMVVLIGFLAMVIDLGRLYVARAGLQNAADAAALSGAKQLNGTRAGICSAASTSCDTDSAVYKALDAAGRNNFFGNLGQETVNIGAPVDSNPNIWFSHTPNGSWVDIATAMASPGDKYYIKVDTASGNLTTWFAPIWNIFATSTFGTAVAGRYLIDVVPLAICALDISKCAESESDDCTGESCDCGFVRGKAYDVAEVNYGGGGISTGAIYWLDPLATTDNCTITSTNAGRPYICQGKSAINTTVGSFVYTNTGVASPLFAALDSRFNFYPSEGKCEYETAPPDENIKEYLWNNLNNPATSWMSAVPATQTAQVQSDKDTRPVVTNNDGVVWSFVRPASGVDPIPASGVYPARNLNTAASGVYAYPTSGVPYTVPVSGVDANSNFSIAPTGNGAAFKKPGRIEHGYSGL